MAAVPALHIFEIGDRVRLGLDGFSYVEGATLQEAADELVAQALRIAIAVRSGALGPLYAECCPDPAVLDFVLEVGETAARGEDIRELLFGPNSLAA
jgi:hypothetical protein